MSVRFPIELLKVKASSFCGTFAFNPYSDYPPAVRLGGSVAFEEVDFGDAAAEPEIFGTKFDSDVRFDGFILPVRDWRQLKGTYDSPEEMDNSIYVGHVHNPVDIHELEFKNWNGCQCDIRLLFTIDFDFEGGGYENVTAELNFSSEFEGLRFCVPNWTSTPRFPAGWKIPKQFTQASVDELVGRFADVDLYERSVEGSTFKYTPRSPS